MLANAKPAPPSRGATTGGTSNGIAWAHMLAAPPQAGNGARRPRERSRRSGPGGVVKNGAQGSRRPMRVLRPAVDPRPAPRLRDRSPHRPDGSTRGGAAGGGVSRTLRNAAPCICIRGRRRRSRCGVRAQGPPHQGPGGGKERPSAFRPPGRAPGRPSPPGPPAPSSPGRPRPSPGRSPVPPGPAEPGRPRRWPCVTAPGGSVSGTTDSSRSSDRPAHCEVICHANPGRSRQG